MTQAKEPCHRLFVGCPLPEDAATALADWASVELADEKVRLVPPDKMHVTLLFYDSVTPEVREELVGLMKQVSWEGVPVSTGARAAVSRGAVAVDLNGSPAQISFLEGRLARVSHHATEAHLHGSERRESDPLHHMAWYLSQVELERKWRRQKGKTLALHVTVARISHPSKWSSLREGQGVGDIPKSEPSRTTTSPPALSFTLDRIALYESFLENPGSRYEVIAEPD